METKFEIETAKILRFFETLEDEYWKTLDEIANGTHIEAGTVAKIITNSGDFVRSSYRVKNGEPLYTSRGNFRDKAPLVDKVIGAFKNRID
jgi:hypothetical protein